MACRQEKRNKKILILANNDVGLYRFRRDLLLEMKSRGNEVFISLPYGEFVDKLKEDGMHFIETDIDRRGINPVTDLRLFFRYIKLLRRLRPDLTVTYTIKPNIYGGLACRLLHQPYAANITGLGSAIENGGFIKKLVLTLYRLALKKARKVFFENQGNLDTLTKSGVIPKGKESLLPGAGINLQQHPYLPYPDKEEVCFLFVGRIMKEKGIDELLFAAEKIKSQYGDRAVFDIVGGFDEETYAGKLTAAAEKKTVNYHGHQSDVEPFYAAASCVVLPSYHEGMSNVLLEAAASGRPLITSDIPGCREAVLPGESGILCPVRDPQALTDALAEFMEFPAEKRKEMGRASRRLMEERFEKSAVVRKTLEALEI